MIDKGIKKSIFVASAIEKLLMLTRSEDLEDVWRNLWVYYNLQEESPGIFRSQQYPELIFVKEDDLAAVFIEAAAFHDDTVIVKMLDILKYTVVFTDSRLAYIANENEFTSDCGECMGDEVVRIQFPSTRKGYITSVCESLLDMMALYLIFPEFVRKVLENDLEDAFDMLS